MNYSIKFIEENIAYDTGAINGKMSSLIMEQLKEKRYFHTHLYITQVEDSKISVIPLIWDKKTVNKSLQSKRTKLTLNILGMMTIDTTYMCSHLQRKLFNEDGAYHSLWTAMQEDSELTAVVRSRQLHIYRNGKKVLVLAGKAAPKIIREDSIFKIWLQDR